MSVDSEAIGTCDPRELPTDPPRSQVRSALRFIAALGFCAGFAGAASSDVARTTARVAELRELLRPPAKDQGELNTLLRSLARLTTPRNSDPQLAAIRELRFIDLPSAAKAIGIALGDSNSPHRRDAALALKEMRGVEALPILLEILDDPDPDLRSIVAGAIGFLGGEDDENLDSDIAKDAEAALAHMLASDPNPRMRLSALDALVMLGTERAAYSAFTLGSKDPDEFVRCGLVARSRDLVRSGNDARITVRVIRAFLNRMLSADSRLPSPGILKRAYYAQKYYSPISRQQACVDVQLAAMSMLAILRDPTALANLLVAATSDVASERASAASALAHYKNDKALAALGQALMDPASGVRQAAIIGLGQSQHPGADPLLVSTLKEATPIDRREAAKALGGSFGASGALILAFADRAVQVRNEAEAALTRGDEIVVKIEAALAALMREARTEANAERLDRRRQKLNEGLARWAVERHESEQALARGLGSQDLRVRIRSARVLAKYRSPESLELLLESLGSGTSPENEMAALALGLRGDPAARSDLESASRSDEIALSVAAIRALQDLRLPESLPLLRSILETDTRERVRVAAGFAVAMLAGKPSA